MALPPGSRLGPYEVNARIGAGGMGEVYRATDTNLKRAVALKILPESFATDPDRLARFQREAEVLASLNHPNIAAIYGLERSTSTSALVMELVEGPTLAERIEQVTSHQAQGSSHKGLPIDEALSIAKQIADALEAAHERGIVHRDLKPANIKVREDGTAKVLDFGLAKALGPPEAGHYLPDGHGGLLQPDLAAAPTISSPTLMTGVGTLLGTAAYMSPEQARGKAVDKRTDIWAFGCVLYEMLAGTRAFDGDDVADTLANVLKVDPDWARLTEEVPFLIRALVRNCLEKDRRKRASDAGAIQFALTHATTAGAASHAVPVVTRPPGRAMWRSAAFPAAALVLGASLVGAGTWFAVRAPARRVLRTTVTLPDAAALTIDGFDRDLAITPDGARIAYAGADGTQLFVRALDALEPTPLATLNGGAQGIFVSPDGQWVGYVENNVTLKKVAITGGPPVTLLKMDGNSRGVTWAGNDTIVFATLGSSGLQTVSATGGDVATLTRPDAAHGEADHLWPEVLPDGRHVLYTITTGGPFELDSAQIAVLDLATGSSKVLVHGGHAAHYVASGHLVYAADGTLRAVGFDPDRLEVRGTPVPVVPRLLTTAVGGADFGVAADGTLVYVDAPGRGLSAMRTLVWVDRQGHEERINVPPRAYAYAQLSPDGTRVALDIRDQQNDIWIWDLARETLQRLTFDPGFNTGPVWAPDGKRLAFSRQLDAAEEVWWQAADGSGMAEPLTASSAGGRVPQAFSPDGQTLLVTEARAPFDLWFARVPAAPPTAGTPLLAGPANETAATVSPNGRWLAYSSDESGRYEVYVRPFPAVTTGRWQISTGGGTRPRWSRDGRELFYIQTLIQQAQAGSGLAVMTVAVDERSGFTAGPPAMVFRGDYLAPQAGRWIYDVSGDGKRFLMIKNAAATSNPPPPQLVVVQHFDEELKRLAPATR